MSSSIPASTPGKPWQPPAPEDLAPELPQYEILGLLGRGGMGAVYKARQKSLNREVAIKVLPPTIEDADMHYAERFIAEAQSMARLEHSNIIAVYDAGQTPGGLLYFVMQYVQGTDVAQMIAASGKLPPEHAYAITAHVCEALAYAHKNGLIHRDIKPANIMVDMEGRVKVADFGLAKAVDAQTGFTQSNLAVGTPDFVAPEALIPGMPVDGRADLYAVGVMLYQMLTGNIPRGAWQPASVMAPGTDPRFDQIIVKAMAYDREQRHHSATELRQHLDSILMPAVPAPDLQRYSSAQMPKTPPAQGRPGVTTARPAAASAPPGAGRAKATPGLRSEASLPVKSKTPLFIGIGAAAAICIGAFLIFSGGEKAKQTSPLAPSSGTSVAAAPKPSPTPTPIKVIEPPKPEPKPVVVAKAPESVKVEPPKPALPEPKNEAPKPAMADATPGRAAGPPAAESVPAATTAEKAPATPSAALAGASALPQAALPSKPALPPELAALDAQFIALQKERVTAPFEADVAKLNTSYLGGIGKKIAEEKAAGHLDGILALEAEQKLITAKQPVPETDDEKTPASLKALRAIYREQLTKLAATRAANLQALIEPLDKRLAQMEADFTKADRLADAKTVRGYREVLGESRLARQSEGAAAAPDRALASTPTPAVSPAAALAFKDSFTNILGMKFLPVPGTKVLFCIHETRYSDYAAYAAEAADVATSWKNQTHDGHALTENKEEHPVVNVSWEDAQAFCAWLSKKEGKTYRLPTDEEWSIAVGLGRKEKRGKNITPAMLSGKETTEFPWDGDFPPKTKDHAGNYSDASRKAKAPRGDTQYLEDYDDGFPTTAPVMSFKPNKFGIYDLGGNVWEWCEDWFDNAKIERVLRGGSWGFYERGHLLSSNRIHGTPTARINHVGFRVVLVVSSSAP
ncbi:MAG: SUMF1/EgtB/PvdO family nonheme iron enzyme [Verrucomicrobiaceae bacterium]